MIRDLKRLLKRIPIIGPLATRLARERRRRRARAAYPGSVEYWERRYATGGTSGHGSYGNFAAFKAEVLNRFVADQGAASILELGCGDGNQLALASYPAYIGFDISPTAIRACRERFKNDSTKTFRVYDPEAVLSDDPALRADLTLSLDVIFHLTEDVVFEAYMKNLFGTAKRFVLIYSSDTALDDPSEDPHIKHRNFSRWVKTHLPSWRLAGKIPNRYPLTDDGALGSFAEFFVYERSAS